jgi:hypothetical protein
MSGDTREYAATLQVLQSQHIRPGDADLSAALAHTDGAAAHSPGSKRTGYLLWATGLGGLFLGRLFVPATRLGGIIPRLSRGVRRSLPLSRQHGPYPEESPR